MTFGQGLLAGFTRGRQQAIPLPTTLNYFVNPVAVIRTKPRIIDGGYPE
jgi:hypothetical protein